MTLFHALVLGIVEGITEYLPVSSTFHLIWTSYLLGLEQTKFLKMFEVVIQTGAIASVTFLYFATLLKERQLVLKVLVSFVPTAVVGFVLYKMIKDVFFEQTMLQIVVFILVGIVFIVFEKYNPEKRLTKTVSQLTYREAVIVGLVQSLAVVPGVSRAGAVILTLMILRVNRKDSATYSFLLAAPTLFAAGALDLTQSYSALTSQTNNILLIVGFTASFISALIVMKWFIRFLQQHDLSLFGWYRIGAGIVFLLLS
ncbi:undecaprenyl-diphosphate phosphatase [Candidatus Roizmanbacteria bacterium]|nr:undecaprenyl-diphosphate phosphatase [Candidatus Roizmanbacteria bacterium]